MKYLKQGYGGILSNELMRDAYTFATAKNIVINIDTIMKWATSVRVIYRFDILLYYRLIQNTW